MRMTRLELGILRLWLAQVIQSAPTWRQMMAARRATIYERPDGWCFAHAESGRSMIVRNSWFHEFPVSGEWGVSDRH